ncbi:hypothetical protein Poli38472_002461 [Pythium oligandrum]|uniref:UDENN domain-containing protein n=1 Tax=Pythium oligandrum TaxID=41045 RepID=A0A8K1CHW0_PYTOL|nr:hypothetical protein Poli38472_002461 [Pythium oligandrum]|eukprot:TMW63520.1 hypothetical protein Poli38472_002461 [Pythium oligandrum]
MATTAAQGGSGMYGLKALATVVFDIDSGQRLDALYPAACDLSEDARQSIAHLSLPHSNKQDEGDTQFTVRFPKARGSSEFLYGFVLFRQQRDASRSRGYFQRALVIVSSLPYVDLFDRVLRVIGPLFFQAGASVLEALYENMLVWPAPMLNTPLSLPLAGTCISCIVPDLLDYSQLDAKRTIEMRSPSPTGHFIADQDDLFEQDENEDGEEADGVDERDPSDGDDADEDDQAVRPPSPSFGDVLLSKRPNQVTAFESIGLYSSFMGVENCLWQLWQLAITGESLIILSPHARTCCQATLAFTSLIAPLKFEGDYRPYYALYEVDFDELVSRHKGGPGSTDKTTVIGTTNPFFMKSFKHWPNAIIFPFLEHTAKDAPRSRLLADGSSDDGCRSVRIKQNVELETLEDSDRALLLRRRLRYVNPDTTVLNQLVSPPEVFVTQTATTEEEPYITINNAILRRHFRKLTKRFLRPFDQYFGVWNCGGTNSHLYMRVEEILKPFDLQSFLASVNPRRLPPQIKRTKWRSLYTAFVKSGHFEPWFQYRRDRCVYEFTQTLRVLRETVTPELLLTSPCGDRLSLDACRALLKEIKATLALEKRQSQREDDDAQLQVIQKHLVAVRERIHQLQGAT